METKNHMPGPWIYSANAREIWTSDGRTTIARIGYCNNVTPRFSGDATEQHANGALIAAAPETAAERDRLREVNAAL